jgi:cytochrome c-type biogenesis protein
MNLLIAYLGGLLSLLSPCSALVIPTFIAAAAHKHHSLIVTTLKFSLGLAIVLLPLSFGFIVFSSLFNQFRGPLTFVIGSAFLLYAIWLLLGKSLSLPDLTATLSKIFPHTRSASTIVLGMVAGIGSTTCVGPILGAILTLSAASGSNLQASLSMASYMAGIVTPLILLSLIGHHFPGKFRTSFLHRSLPGKISHLTLYKVLMILLFVFLAYVFIRYQANLSALPCSRQSNWLNSALDFQDSLFSR